MLVVGWASEPCGLRSTAPNKRDPRPRLLLMGTASPDALGRGTGGTPCFFGSFLQGERSRIGARGKLKAP